MTNEECEAHHHLVPNNRCLGIKLLLEYHLQLDINVHSVKIMTMKLIIVNYMMTEINTGIIYRERDGVAIA